MSIEQTTLVTGRRWLLEEIKTSQHTGRASRQELINTVMEWKRLLSSGGQVMFQLNGPGHEPRPPPPPLRNVNAAAAQGERQLQHGEVPQ